MRKLSVPQRRVLDTLAENDGFLNAVTWFEKSTLDSLVRLSLITYTKRRKSASYGRSMRGFSGHAWNVYYIRMTPNGWEHVK